jgi:hypothetical protein
MVQYLHTGKQATIWLSKDIFSAQYTTQLPPHVCKVALRSLYRPGMAERGHALRRGKGRSSFGRAASGLQVRTRASRRGIGRYCKSNRVYCHDSLLGVEPYSHADVQ